MGTLAGNIAENDHNLKERADAEKVFFLYFVLCLEYSPTRGLTQVGYSLARKY
jgi:hypothetical protein